MFALNQSSGILLLPAVNGSRLEAFTRAALEDVCGTTETLAGWADAAAKHRTIVQAKHMPGMRPAWQSKRTTVEAAGDGADG
jgi:hypothetical protein